MVNDTKQNILNKLKKESSWQSGEQISRVLGVSRVAVWKQIKSLINQGYPIESGPRGYRMLPGKDTLSALEFNSDGEILFFKELTSTMDEAQRQIALQSPEHRHFLILADHQSGGVGRDEQNWDSPSGGIYMTFVIRETMSTEEIPLLKRKAVLSVLETLNSLNITGIAYRESGDILLKDRKTGGILEEYHVRGVHVKWLALGLGLHLNDSPAAPMISVKDHAEAVFNRSDIVKQLKKNWDSYRILDSATIDTRLASYPDH